MNPPTPQTSRSDARPAKERRRSLGASARNSLLEQVRAARKRLAKTPPRLARLR